MVGASLFSSAGIAETYFEEVGINIVAANTIGADNIKEYLAADSRSIPIALAVVIVTPDLETPGMNANDCDNPIKNVCLKDISSYFTLTFK